MFPIKKERRQATKVKSSHSTVSVECHQSRGLKVCSPCTHPSASGLEGRKPINYSSFFCVTSFIGNTSTSKIYSARHSEQLPVFGPH